MNIDTSVVGNQLQNSNCSNETPALTSSILLANEVSETMYVQLSDTKTNEVDNVLATIGIVLENQNKIFHQLAKF